MSTPDEHRIPTRDLKITPRDLRQSEFSAAIRGFDRAEVTALLLEAADEYEKALRENDDLREQVVRLDAALTQYRALESSLNATLMTAQKVSDEMRGTATLEAERIVREAEGHAELILQKARAGAEDVHRETDTLKVKRREVETSVEAMIAVLHHTLDFVRRQETKVVPHRPPVEIALRRASS